jgi:hypothetical protein
MFTNLASTKEAEREVQNVITFMKEFSHESSKHIESAKYIKSYKTELGIESQLRRLSQVIFNIKNESKEEMNKFKSTISSECLRIRCKQVEDQMKLQFSDEENYGDDD